MKTRLSRRRKLQRRAIVGLWKRREENDGADTLITDVEDADEISGADCKARHLGLPWTICETERLILREIAERDYEEIVKNHVDDGLDTAEKIAGYTKRHYEVFEFGFWAVEEKNGNLAGVVGFRIRRMMRPGMWKTGFCLLTMKISWMTRWNSDTISFRNIGDRGMRKRHVWRLLNMRKEFRPVQFLARIEKDNIVSKKVAERLGFVRAA